MQTWSRAVHTSLGVAALVALAQPGAVAPPQSSDLAGSAPSASSTPASPINAGTRKVRYHGVRVDVPASWPVVDLQADPHACVRLDRPAVYLGDPAPQQDCPAHLVGHADTVWLHGTTPSSGFTPAARSAKVGTLPAQVSNDPVGHGRRIRFTHQDVQLDASWGTASQPVDDVLATATPAAGPSTTAPTTAPSPTSAASPAAYGAPALDLSSAALTATTTTASSTFTGMAFDTCAAPTSTTMQHWLASPYRTLGIYIGGSMRACGDGPLSASWVSTVKSMGWGLAPIYVGPQAPCVNQGGLATFSASSAAAQARTDADDAANRASSFGMARGTPIYYDMEAYNTTAPGCSSAVMTFISAWSKELAALGYSSGAYGSTSSLMTDMSKAMGTSGFVAPTNIWFADWNGLQTTSDSYFSGAHWTNHQRLHQYSGGVNQTWGGDTINIDANWVDGQVAGVAAPVSYGTNVVGPGSAGFVFTGDMSYWRPNAPQGLKGMAYWTNSSGNTEYNGATWAPRLAPGLYKVQAYIPGTNAWATAPYTVRYAGGSTVKKVNQQQISGYTSLGTYLASSSSSISVHVGDNDGTGSPAPQLGVDAMAFQLVATAPGAPSSVAATSGDGNATVTWGAAAANGSPVTSYTVKATPGGASVTVPGTTTSAAFSGLTNGTAYSFTVTATNAVGPGPAATSNAVTPHSPLALVHDWNGDTHNDVLARDGSGNLWLYPGNGTAGWLPRQQSGTGWNAMSVITASGDFNGDGRPDLLARDGSGTLWLYPGNGTGGWLTRQQVGNGWNAMTAVAAPGDFNGDGHPDLLARDGSGTLWLYPGNGTGGWLTRQQVGTSWNGMTALS
ncbi:glycoside hydrolase domain-containing protein [Pedococcus sp.]|uniref:glycoside hydrolase domain-containing protein n=1 Tax=Pedococcus sp. TaxID=2860345 RepID=UPI002E167A20|nr:glycoside hydrolase domain-containing protein [Pedococcus sp.]